MNDKVKKFNKFETIFFRIHLFVFGFGAFLLMLMFLAQNAIESIARTFLVFAYFMMYVVIINFIISLVRLLKYLFAFKDIEESPSIKRTLAIILTSPISLAIFFIVTLTLSLSLASCSF
ncbi:hypothetical protein KQ51_01285 [Candidatus Izimaplasma bacterium HR1]|jgi:hypothetical protein|uniref:hypothetical protein n=1 Tax=Candidatus Izimoplasma sp. HR1 TaxID=1541959 RepID=UPI0004F814B2|nr:hypothetical protein KQ51_01285 [Candidatus Izimaplasma bacterium HR1]